MSDPIRALCAERPSVDELGLIYHDCCRGCEFMDQVGFEDAALVVLARWGRPTPPAPPAEGEVAELVEFLRTYGDYVMDEYGDVGEHEQLTRAAELLERYARWSNHFPDATKMVPPSEEEPTGVIDAIADCLQADAPSSTILDRIAALLERHAAPVPVPLPAPQGGEVEP